MKEIEYIDELHRILSAVPERKRRYTEEIQWLERWKNIWHEDRIRIGVIGVTSSGKSTLINAILGDNLLTVKVHPSSSQIVSCSYAKKPSAVIYFQDGTKEHSEDSQNLGQIIQKYSDEDNNRKNERNVAQVEVSVPGFALGEDILLIDSPGLDASGYEMHEKLTLETLLPTVDVVVFVTSAKSDIDQKLKQILSIIAKYRCPTMLVQNMLDSVRPSPDGRKSAAIVAKERLNRVEKIVKQSAIEKKLDIRIIQMSAVNAMYYRCIKSRKEDYDEEKGEQLYKESRYKEFVDGVRALVANKLPVIAEQRITTITEHMEELIRQEDSTQSQNTNVFSAQEDASALDAMKERIDSVYAQTQNAIQTVIDSLCHTYSKYFPNEPISEHKYTSIVTTSSKESEEKHKFNETEIKEIKKQKDSFEKGVAESIAFFSKECRFVIRKLKLPERDMWSYNGLPAAIPEAEIVTRTRTVPRTVDKPGVFNKIRRFLHWGGTETKNEKQSYTDNEATRESVKRHLERLISEYQKTLDVWQRNTEATMRNIQYETKSRIEAAEKRRQEALTAAAWEETKSLLLKCIASYKPKHSKIKPTTDISSGNIDYSLSTEKKHVPSDLRILYEKAEDYLYAVQCSILRRALLCCRNSSETDPRLFPTLIVSEDGDNIRDFLFRFYRVRADEHENQGKENGITEQYGENLHTILHPVPGQLHEMLKPLPPLNLIVLVNVMQMHTTNAATLFQILREEARDDDIVFLVICDFDTVANGGGIKESMQSILEMQSSIPAGKKGMVLMSHSNPVFQIAMLYGQSEKVKIADETLFYDALQKKFPFLVNETIKKQLSAILRTGSDDSQRKT